MRGLLLRVAGICLGLASFGAAAAADYATRPALPSAAPAQAQLTDIELAGERLVIAGERGLIAWSEDQGRSWEQSRVPVSETLTALSFPTSEHGWAVGHGGVILHSGDGGKSWQQQFDGNDANRQRLELATKRMSALQATLETASPDDKADLEYELEEAQFAVEDAELAIETGPADPFLDVWFADAQVGWAVGAYGMLFRTNNGGLQWRIASAGIENIDGYHYYSLAASKSGQLYLSGEAGLLYRSDDGGDNWLRLPLDYDGSLFGVLAAGTDTVVCFGLRGNIFRSTDRGETWASIEPSNNANLSFYGGKLLTERRMVVVGAGGVMTSSSDAGETFVSDVHSARSTFSSVVEIDGDLLLTGMEGLVRIPHSRSDR